MKTREYGSNGIAKVSVIVPVYNGETCISTCLDSIRSQYLHDIEIVVVNDGSTDGTAEICEKYAEFDERIVVVHQVNGGVSRARNAGVRIATGEYIGFVDSDDYVHSQMYATLHQSAKKAGADVVIGNCYRGAGDSLSRWPSDFTRQGTIERSTILQFLENPHQGFHSIWPVWTNLYKREFLQDNKVEFNESVQHAEDLLFNLHALYAAKVVTHEPDYVYYHVSNGESVTQRSYINKFPDKLECTFDGLFDFYRSVGLWSEAFIQHQSTVIIESLGVWLLTNAWQGPRPWHEVRHMRRNRNLSFMLQHYQPSPRLSVGMRGVWLLMKHGFVNAACVLLSIRLGMQT